MQDNLNETAFDQACDPVFQQEQDHLSDTYAKLEAIAKNLSEKMERRRWQAAKDKDDMQGEVKHNFASDGEAQETYVDYAVLNNLIRDYNLEQDADSERLAAAAKLLEQPYFAKISLEMRAGAPAKVSTSALPAVADENYRRWWSTGAALWPRCTTTRKTVPLPTRPTAAPSKSTCSTAASSTSRAKRFARISTPMSPSRTRCCCNRFPRSAPNT